MSLFTMTGLVLKSLFRKPFTHRYPFEPRVPVPGMRGAVAVDLSTCIFCGLCVRKCPTQALEVDRAAKRWTIDRLRCISCGACVEACPKKCLRLTTDHGVAVVTRDREVFEHA